VASSEINGSTNEAHLHPESGELEELAASGVFEGTLSVEQALEKIRRRLLDLSNRNRLLNYRHPRGRSAQIVDVDFNGVFNRLTDGKECVFRGIPEPNPSEYKGQRPDARTWAKELHEIDVSIELGPSNRTLPVANNSSRALRVLQYPPELARLLHNISRDARLAIEETGSNYLYLVFGFLEFYEAPQSERPLLAPLLALPVSVAKKGQAGGYNNYEVLYTGDDINGNLSLLERMKRDFDLNLPTYDTERHSEDPEQYLEDVREVVNTRPRWRVKRQLSLALLSFGKLALWTDLDPQRWSQLLDHGIVKSLFQGNTSALAIDPQEYKVDELEDLDQLIYEADSSQHNVLANAVNGRTLVVNGPPGTGKSQTITNLIALSLAAGKTVLFVAEKMAALDVVRKRLHEAGLSDFCLELHSHKTQKRKLLDSLEVRMKTNYLAPGDVERKRRLLTERKNTLSRYVETLNMVLGNRLGMTVFEVLWAADRRRGKLGEQIGTLEQIRLPFAGNVQHEQVEQLRSLITDLSDNYVVCGGYGPDHPWYGFYPLRYPPGFEIKVRTLLVLQMQQAKEAGNTIENLCAALRVASSEYKHCRLWVSAFGVLETIKLPPRIQPGLLSFVSKNSTNTSLQSVLEDLGAKVRSAIAMQKAFRGYVLEDVDISEDTVIEVRKCAHNLKAIGFADAAISELGDLASRLLDISRRIVRALSTFSEAAEMGGLVWRREGRDVETVRAMVKIADTAPFQELSSRSRGFDMPDINAVVQRARNESMALSLRRKKLEEDYYLDFVPDEKELIETVQILRQQTSIWRWISGPWRRARKQYVSLAKTKERKESRAMADELAMLAKLLSDESAYLNRKNYQEAFGSLFSGIGTDWSRIERLANWYVSSRKELISAGSQDYGCDLTSIEMDRLSQLKSAYTKVVESYGALAALYGEVKERIDECMLEEIASSERGRPWKVIADRLAAGASTLNEAQTMLESICSPQCTANLAIPAIEAKVQYETLVRSLESYEEAHRILGTFYQGLNTDLSSLSIACAWVQGVRSSELEEELKSIILSSDDIATIFNTLEDGTSQVAKLWGELSKTRNEMVALGELNLEEWMGVSDDVPESIFLKCDRAVNQLDGLLAWQQYNWSRHEARRNGLSPLVEKLEQQEITADKLHDAYEFCIYHSMAMEIAEARPELATFSGATHDKVRSQYVQLDREIIRLTGRDFAFRMARDARVPEGNAGYGAASYTERQLLLREIAKQKKHIPIRQLLKRAGRAIVAYKPCFMMSPLSVAHYLEPGAIEFDLIVMDEASQIRPEDAISAIARGKQVVVVGDPKQLPPTTFFDRLADAGDDEGGGEDEALLDLTTGTESILDVFQQLYPTLGLNWHYRSKHHSLIAFSNKNFYHDRLVVFPAPYPNHVSLGLQNYHIKNGNYSSRQNLPEAMRIVDAAIEHMLKYQDRSMGIVTLAITQRDLIEMIFEKKSRNFPQVQEYLARWESNDGHSEPFFIKNLENVQGDERDVIFISTTFGPTNGAPPRQNFGPISKRGGERRLNVLFTRAKHGVHLFTSMIPEDIVVDAKTPIGTQTLRNYLEYARSGILEGAKPSERAPDSDFEISVADVLRANGFDVIAQMGVAGFFIDLVVKNPYRPGEYLAAIECDGASYHSGASVRDRDRIRQEILESLGWKDKIYRVWSTDWFRSRTSQVQKLLDFLRTRLHQAKTRAVTEPPPTVPKSEVFTQEHPTSHYAEAKGDVVEVSSEDAFVEVGDTVTYIMTARPRERRVAHIVDGDSRPEQGIHNQETAIAVALLGLEIGGEEDLMIDGKRQGLVRVLKIEKP
jgi:very-short-patch-repair endonuclease